MCKLNFYTDGGSRGNPGTGGWGVYCPELDLRLYGWGGDSVTNNQMELTAVLKALAYVNAYEGTEYDELIIHSDSAYVVDTFTKWVWNWLNEGTLKGKKNSTLISRILTARKLLILDEWSIKFNKVAGHADNPGNIIADTLCNIAMDTKTETPFRITYSKFEEVMRREFPGVYMNHYGKSNKIILEGGRPKNMKGILHTDIMDEICVIFGLESCYGIVQPEAFFGPSDKLPVYFEEL